jgi:hypothetical protein
MYINIYIITILYFWFNNLKLISGIDYWRVLLLGAGVLLFISAPKLSASPLFYYICGISVGICASFLILVYMMSKLLPKVKYAEL